MMNQLDEVGNLKRKEWDKQSGEAILAWSNNCVLREALVANIIEKEDLPTLVEEGVANRPEG